MVLHRLVVLTVAFVTSSSLGVPASQPADIPLVDVAAIAISTVRATGAQVVKSTDADGSSWLVIDQKPDSKESIVSFDIPAHLRDLSQRHYLEIDAQNVCPTRISLTCWALSGPGWGGVSTYPIGNASGRETLESGASQGLKIDLFARYSGTDVYTGAIDPGDVRRVEIRFASQNAGPKLQFGNVRASSAAPGPRPDISNRIEVPPVVDEPPAPGKRARYALKGWETTTVRHILTLPRNWKPGGRYPIIVEYTGNIFFHKFCYSTGLTEQGRMAYGLSKGEDFILLNLPFITPDRQSEQSNGWGDLDKAADYCLEAVDDACEKWGGDRSEIFLTGFSRGMLAMNVLGLHDDRIAALWLGFIGDNPGKNLAPTTNRGWNGANTGWNERALRLRGRSWFSARSNLGADVHVDVEYLEDRPSTLAARKWMQEVLAMKRNGSKKQG